MAHPLVNNANAMNLEDESLVSAYIDGQLDPEQLQAVESALLSNSRLSEQLRTLTIVRDLVGGLSRDASVDVSTAVLKRIRPSRRPWVRVRSTISRFDGRGQRMRTAVLLGIAASTIYRDHHRLELADGVASSPFRIPKRIPRPSQSPRTTFNKPRSPTRSAKRLVPFRWKNRPHPILQNLRPAPSSVSTSEIAATNASTEISNLDQSRDLESVRKLLDDPNLKRFFFVRGRRDGTAR